MNTVYVEKGKFQLTDRNARSSDYSVLISDVSDVREEGSGELVGLYLKFPEDIVKDLRELFQLKTYIKNHSVGEVLDAKITNNEAFKIVYFLLNEILKVHFSNKNLKPINTAYFFKDTNKTYHKDTITKGGLSVILTLTEGCSGGYLVCPELNIAFKQTDCALTIFPGNNLLHGVTPIIKNKPKGYRTTLVFYHKD